MAKRYGKKEKPVELTDEELLKMLIARRIEAKGGRMPWETPYGPYPWDGKKTIGGSMPKVEVNSFVRVLSIPEDEETGDPLGFVPETVAMIDGSYEVLVVKIMVHPKRGKQFIYGVHFLEQNKLQYFWPWNIEEDKGR